MMVYLVRAPTLVAKATPLDATTKGVTAAIIEGSTLESLPATMEAVQGGESREAALESANTEPHPRLVDNSARSASTSRLTFPQRARPFISGITLVLGMLLWFFLLTDYSLVGTLPDFLFPPAMLVLGIAAFMWARYADTSSRTWLSRLVALPAIIGGSLYLVAVGLAFMPPQTLGAMFFSDAMASEVRLQEATSPDGSRVAEVYWLPGGYSGSFNRALLVKVRYPILPFVERDIFSTALHLETTEGEHISWRDNDTLYLFDTGAVIKVGAVKGELPLVMRMAISQFDTWAEIERKQERTVVLTGEVSRVPLYPSSNPDLHTEYLEDDQTQFRSYDVQGASADEVVQWYKGELSRSPWLLIRADRYEGEDVGQSYTRDCVQASYSGEGGQGGQTYYVEVMGNASEESGVHVNIGTPKPITDTCERFTGER